jgi:transcriptional regulator of heat shock response
MVSLEKQGLLSHIHTSSGRVPTKEGFKLYVRQFDEEDFGKNYPVSVDFSTVPGLSFDGVIDYTLDTLASLSGYASLVAVSGSNEKAFYKGIRFILEQPEFEDIHRLREIFYLLEERMDVLQNLLFERVSEKIEIFIGDDIGCEEFADCAFVVSGLREKDAVLALSVFGPMRMNYAKAASCLQSVTKQLRGVIEGFLR